MVNITKETWEKKCVEVIIFNGEKWLNEKHVEQELEHSNLREVTSKYLLDLRKKKTRVKKM